MILWRKTIRDIRQNKAQFFAIFLMIFLGVFIYAGVNSEWYGMQVYSDKFYEETNLADNWVTSASFSNQNVVTLKKQEGVQEVERRAILPASDVVSKNKKLTLYALENNELSTMHIVSGKRYDRNLDGLWLDERYAQENKIRVGDVLSIHVQGETAKKKVVALVYHPEFVYMATDTDILPDHSNTGFAIISSNYLPHAKQIVYSQIAFTVDTPQLAEKALAKAFTNRIYTNVEREDLPSYAMLQDEIKQHQAFGNVFPIVFLLIALLTTITTVSKMILYQRQQIGILKAVGFSNKKVLFHYLSHILLITTLAALLGYVIGPLVIPHLLFPLMKSVYTLPALEEVSYSYSILLMISSVLLCFVTAFIICRKQLKESAASTLHPRVRKEKSGSFIVKSRLWKRCSFYIQWNLRDILRNKVRSLMAIVGIAGCMGLLFCAFGLQDTLQGLIDTMYGDMQRYVMRVDINEQANKEVIKQRIQGEAIQESLLDIKLGNTNKKISLTIQEGNRYMKLERASDYQQVELPNEGIALSRNLADANNMKQGDSLTWRIVGSEEWKTSIVKEIIYTPSVQGITMSKKEYERYGFSFQPNVLVGEKANVKDMVGITSVKYMDEIKNEMSGMMDSMNLMIVLLTIGAVLLGLVVLYNIGTFSYYEKIREMATLKVLGFQDHQIQKLLRQQNSWLTICGILVGVPFGYYLIYVVISTTGDSVDYRITTSMFTLLLCSIGTLCISSLVIWKVSRRVKQIDMVEALKAIE